MFNHIFVSTFFAQPSGIFSFLSLSPFSFSRDVLLQRLDLAHVDGVGEGAHVAAAEVRAEEVAAQAAAQERVHHLAGAIQGGRGQTATTVS